MKAYAAAQKNLKHTYKRSGGPAVGESKLSGGGNAFADDNIESNLDSSIQRSETQNDEDEEDEDSFLSEDFEDEEDKTTTNKTIANGGKTSRSFKSNNDFYSRRNSMMSRKSVMRKDFKRMNTAMSRMSRTSRVSRVSKNSGKS